VTAHDMAPYLRSCRVDADVNSVVLEFSPPLSSVTFHDSWGSYRFAINVQNLPCSADDWKIDSTFSRVLCDDHGPGNFWRMEFGGRAAKSETYVSSGYSVYGAHAVTRRSYEYRETDLAGSKLMLAHNKRMCVSTGKKAGRVELQDCEEAARFVLPATGAGPIRIAGSKPETCLNAERAEGQKQVIAGPCGDVDASKWFLPGEQIGQIMLDGQENVCLGVDGTSLDVGMVVEQTHCVNGPGTTFRIPTQGIPHSKNPKKVVASRAVIRKSRRRFCSARVKCKFGCSCSSLGVCDPTCDSKGSIFSHVGMHQLPAAR